MSTNSISADVGAASFRQIEDLAGRLNGETARWMAFCTTPRHEKVVSRYLDYEALEYYLPLITVRRAWRNRTRVEVELPLFPGYVFARVERSKCHRVLRAPGVMSVVGSGRNPAIVEDTEIETLRNGLSARNAEPHPLLVVGQRARVRCGAFAGKEGILVRKEKNLRVVLTMEAIMKSFAVEVDGDEVEMVA